MNRNCKRIASVATLCLLVLQCSGCKVDEGANVVIVNAERVQSASLDTMHALWKIDDFDRPMMRANFPDAHAFVEESRRTFPGYYAQLSMAIATYKMTRSPDAGSKLDNALNQIEQLARMARNYLIKISAGSVG